MKKRVLVVSSANMDFVQRMRRVPNAGETIVESAEYGYGYVPGGKGANSAVAFARMGDDCVFCTRLGADANGDRLLSVYQKEGIDTRFAVRDKEAATGLASILVEEDGTNRILVYPGANERLNEEDVEEAFTCYPDAVYLQFEIPDEPVLAAAKFAAEKNIPLFVDAGPARADYPLDQLGRVEIFSPNETETKIFTGIDPNSAENCLRAAIKLAGMVDAKYIVIKLGGRGAFLYDGKYYHIIPSISVPVADTTAAGDTFTAALIHFYLDGVPMVDAVHLANCAAAIGVSRPGAYTSIPTIKEVLAFADRHPR
ncbi:MAG: ribokinase [Clostridia bacterium]|nr:ribokinase [Clostridia bacterium]